MNVASLPARERVPCLEQTNDPLTRLYCWNLGLDSWIFMNSAVMVEMSRVCVIQYGSHMWPLGS